jgi:hypothetical protein
MMHLTKFIVLAITKDLTLEVEITSKKIHEDIVSILVLQQKNELVISQNLL